jgi:hypothetical protein
MLQKLVSSIREKEEKNFKIVPKMQIKRKDAKCN